MAAYPINAETKFALQLALNALTAGVKLALSKIPDDQVDLREGLSQLMSSAQSILGNIIDGAREK